MKITSRIAVLVSGASLSFFVALAISLWGLHSYRMSMELAISNEVESILLLNKIQSASSRNGQLVRDMALAPSNKSLPEHVKQSETVLTAHVSKLHEQLKNRNSLKEQAAGIQKVTTEYSLLNQEIVRLIDSGAVDDAKKLLQQKHASAERELEQQALALAKALDSQLFLQRNDADKQASAMSQIAIICALAASIGAAIFLVFLVRSISRAMADIRNGVQAIIEGGGDLRCELKVNANDEFGQLANTINMLICWLRETVTFLYRDGGHVAVKVCEMGKATRTTVSTAMTQNEAAAAVASAAEEMTSSLSSVADNTHTAATVAATVNLAANTGMAAVEKACECMVQIRESVEVTKGMVSRLTDSSIKIGEIANMIKDIADQTNLLALNAAIEAARAGEHGRGFAVVADEVKSLSSKTALSTREISGIIRVIQQESQQALMAMQNEYMRVVDGVNTAQGARNELSQILSLADESKEMIEHIASATEEQSAVTAEITRRIHCISDMANSVSSQMKETDNTLMQLSEVAENIFSSIGRFSVGTYHDEKRALVMNFRDKVIDAIERAMESGSLSMEQLFSRNYVEIPNTLPQKYTTAFDSFFDRVINPIQEEVMAASPDILSLLCIDEKGYVPSQISANKARTKLILNDRVTQRHCQNTGPFLLQTFERPSTGEIIIDLSCPIIIRGKQWGFVRCGYKPRE
ncbi:methyl-accepting chemotaxis protein [Formivibrio citricus]|uniref:Methyl-accepting chemotaxis protein n=1 Tax=Formivibrio citricus TaxID=83765 RepID=A0A1I5BY45_9NEIS|nr:methyl-accepting chemotaxis protein [Formivibrio citricus]